MNSTHTEIVQKQSNLVNVVFITNRVKMLHINTGGRVGRSTTPLDCSDPIDRRGTMIRVTYFCMATAHCIGKLLPSPFFLIYIILLSIEA